jgi:hypothetical protein
VTITALLSLLGALLLAGLVVLHGPRQSPGYLVVLRLPRGLRIERLWGPWCWGRYPKGVALAPRLGMHPRGIGPFVAYRRPDPFLLELLEALTQPLDLNHWSSWQISAVPNGLPRSS